MIFRGRRRHACRHRVELARCGQAPSPPADSTGNWITLRGTGHRETHCSLQPPHDGTPPARRCRIIASKPTDLGRRSILRGMLRDPRGRARRGSRVMLTPSCTPPSRWPRSCSSSLPGDEVIVPSFTFVSTASASRCGARNPIRRHPPRYAEPRSDRIRSRSPIDTAPSCPCTTPASAARWTQIGAIATARVAVVEDNAHGLFGRTAASRSGTFGALATPELPRHQELHVRRRRRAAGQRPRARRARRDHPREGHEPQPVLPRSGRQVHVGRRRLELPAVGHPRRAVLLSQLEARERDPGRAAQIWTPLRAPSSRSGRGTRRPSAGGAGHTASSRITCSTC